MSPRLPWFCPICEYAPGDNDTVADACPRCGAVTTLRRPDVFDRPQTALDRGRVAAAARRLRATWDTTARPDAGYGLGLALLNLGQSDDGLATLQAAHRAKGADPRWREQIELLVRHKQRTRSVQQVEATRPDRSGARNKVLAEVLAPGRFPSPPPIALQVVRVAGQPDCDPSEIVALLSQDPALCAKLLRAVNSCLYGLSKPVASISRAVTVLGLNPVRSLTLGLSLSEVRAAARPDDALREYWVRAAAAGIFARELAIRTRRPAPEDDLVAGLLQDLGAVLLQRTFPDRWAARTPEQVRRLVTAPWEVEEELFGINHTEVSARVLQSWNLPEELVEPIRYHHHPERLSNGNRVLSQRAELLNFVGNLTELDSIAHDPDHLAAVLATAKARFGLGRSQLIKFLGEVAPKLEAFDELVRQDVAPRHDFAAMLGSGAEEMVRLTVETNRDRLKGGTAETRLIAHGAAPTVVVPASSAGLPAFRPEFVERMPAGGCRLGDYELRRQIGRGAMGAVFEAFEPALQRFVAIKILSPELDACVVARHRFVREARVAAAIQHENVVAIHAVREVAGLPYLVMECVRGGCLDGYLAEHGPLQGADLARVSRQLAAGLAAAHERNVVHRDIKPANVLWDRETGRVRLTDFGLARVSDDLNLSAAGTRIGTPYYMAPEVVDGHPATTASDLFSLGGVFYTLCTGRPPFAGSTAAEVFRAITMSAPTPPRQVRPDVPYWFEDVIWQLLERDPRDRNLTASQVAAQIAQHATG